MRSKSLQMKVRYLVLACLVILVLLLSSNLIYYDILDIATVKKNADNAPALKKKPVRYFGVISRYSPFLIYEGYQPVMDYLSENTLYRFELKLSKNYEQTIRQLAGGEVAAAFLGSYLYIKKRKPFHLRCILKPLNQNRKPYFHSVLIYSANRPLKDIADLAHKKIALPAPLSYSANWLLSDILPRLGLPQSALDSVHFFSHHNTVVYQVLKGKFDAGVVKERVARDYFHQGIRILARSPGFPSSPVVVSFKTDSALVRQIRQALLKIDISRPGCQRLLSGWDAEFRYGFVPANDADYDSLAALMGKGERL